MDVDSSIPRHKSPASTASTTATGSLPSKRPLPITSSTPSSVVAPAQTGSAPPVRATGLGRLLATDAAKRVTAIPPCPVRSEASAWLCDVYGELTGQNLGGAYNDGLEAFLALEATYEYEKGGGKLPALHRPVQVHNWIRNRRVARPAYCGIPDTAKFSEEYWAWWMAMQPSWRPTMKDGRPGSAQRNGESWGTMVAPGVNGMLTAFAALYWWGCEEKTRNTWPTSDWVQAVEDATRVCASLREEAKEEAEESAKRAKRQRI
ncbi:hypothetical protein C8F01DRAFT_983181 [Mycena amicta]|nr:hypothetical protein C8F01DRAFT_983181 [Mycena amicta]